MSKREVRAQIYEGVAGIEPARWDGAGGAANPFTAHTFLAALERSGSVGPGTGWQAAPIGVATNRAEHFLPAYFKSHSQGEYVFDHSWADAWERAGGAYYP